MKKSILKKWWFWLIVVVVIGVLFAGLSDEETERTEMTSSPTENVINESTEVPTEEVSVNVNFDKSIEDFKEEILVTNKESFSFAKGDIADVIMERTSVKRKEQEVLKKQIAKESIQYPTINISEVKFFLSRMKKGDINDIKYQRLLVDTFIRKIILYDDKVIIYYNIKEEQSQYNFDCKSSSNGHLPKDS